MQKNIRYSNDQWTLDDGLGIARTGDLAARMALEAQPPFSMRVTGKWGSGKTSVLKRAFVTLKGNPVRQAVPLGEDVQEAGSEEWIKWHYDQRSEELAWSEGIEEIAARSLCVWYSPWQHQGAKNPLVPLLLEIRAQYSSWMKLKDKMGEANRRGGLAALTLLERVIDAGVSLYSGKGFKFAQGTSQAILTSWREAAPNLAELSNGQRFHLLFEDAVQNVLASLPKKEEIGQSKEVRLLKSRLIVFIDDLDRCEESVIVELLECVKLYLGSPRCVFILGIDDAAVLGAMQRCWTERSHDDNREYLEKMFQATLSVPPPRPEAIRSMVEKRLTAHGFPAVEQCAEAVEELLEPNPRKIKNFLNGLCAAWGQFGGNENAGEDHENHALRFILFHYLRRFHSSIWRILERQPQALLLLHRVLSNSPDPIPKLEFFDPDDQRVLRELFEREFSHVLRDDGRGTDDDFKYHRNLPLDEAVRLFEARLDSKRSDEFFIHKFNELPISFGTELALRVRRIPQE